MAKQFSISPRKPPPAIDAFVAGLESSSTAVDGLPHTVNDKPETENGRPYTADAGQAAVQTTDRPRARRRMMSANHVPVTVDRRRSTVPWEATHQRVTFHCPRVVISEVEEEVRRSGRSKSRVIVEAIRAHLAGAENDSKG
jgi:hypothetical protein